jgi:hypothetical protein
MRAHPIYDETREAMAGVLGGAKMLIEKFCERLQDAADTRAALFEP